jgi:hypothetical protein
MLDVTTLLLELAEVKQEVRNLTVIALDPSLPPEYRRLVKVLEWSARTEAKLRWRVLEYQLALEQHAEGDA